MKKRIALTTPLLLLATSYCQAQTLTLAEADTIIVVLIFVVIVLLVLGGFGLHYNRVISRRNEQLLRILNALDDYRAIVANGAVSLDEQEDVLKVQQPKSKAVKAVQTDGSQAFYVKMDARVNKEKPFTNPDFDQRALADFMGVDVETFCLLVPRYKDPERTLDYINSLRAEYAAKILMEHSDSSMDEMPSKCGFTNSGAFYNAFKFAFGITPTDYVHGMSTMFKKKALPILVMTAAMLSLASCDSNDNKEGVWDSMIWEAEAQVQKTDGIYHVPTDGGTITFTCRNYSAPWIENAEYEENYYFPPREEGIYHAITANWFKAEIVGNKLSVTFESNGNDQTRPLKIEVTAGDIFYTFRFEQSGMFH